MDNVKSNLRIVKLSPRGKKNSQQRLVDFLSNRYEFRYNTVRLGVEYRLRGSSSDYKRINEATFYNEINCLFGNVAERRLWLTIHSEDISNYYNPIKIWLESLTTIPTDSDPFEELTALIGLKYDSAEERLRLYVAFKKWFVGAIKTLYDPFYVHKQAIVLQGKQEIGKTMFCRSLLPFKMGEYVKSDLCLDMNSKDGQRALLSNFLLVIDEIDRFLNNKRNRDAYKAYMSQKYSNFRLQWNKLDTYKQRISCFVGTFNSETFIKDETGSSRFSIFGVSHFHNEPFLGYKKVELFDIEKCWSKAYELFKNGFNPEYSKAEKIANEEANERFKCNTPEFETLLKFVIKKEPGDIDSEFQTATEICTELNRVQYSFQFKIESLGRALSRLGFEKKRKKIDGKCVYGYYIKYKPL